MEYDHSTDSVTLLRIPHQDNKRNTTHTGTMTVYDYEAMNTKQNLENCERNTVSYKQDIKTLKQNLYIANQDLHNMYSDFQFYADSISEILNDIGYDELIFNDILCPELCTISNKDIENILKYIKEKVLITRVDITTYRNTLRTFEN